MTVASKTHSHELVSEDVTLLQPQHLRVVKVQVGSADGRTGNFDDDILVLRDVRDGGIDHPHVHITEPSEGSHRRTIGAMLVFGVDSRCRGGRRLAITNVLQDLLGP